MRETGMPSRIRELAALSTLAFLAALPASATASEPPAKPEAPNTVTGVTVTPEKKDPVVDPASQFVRGHIPENRGGQLARFRDKVCVRVVGLPASYDVFIARQVVKIAAQVHAPVDRARGCTPNVNVIFSPDPQAQLDDIAKRRDILFGFHWAAKTKSLATFDRPIQSWYLTRSVGTDGQDILELNHGATFMDVGPGAPPDSIGGSIKGRPGSRLGTDQSSELVHSLVLVDAGKVANLKAGAVADYIAVLALSRWEGLTRCNAIATILNLLADDCADAPESATEGDLGLLSALYALDPREAGSQQRLTMAGRMRAELKKAEPEPSPHP
jgi:hypothetical protein